MSRMTEEATNIKFLHTVQQHPHLYNYNLAEYSRRDVTEKSWAQIARENDCTVMAAKEKWKNLRAVYVRKRKPLPNGSTKRYIKPYYLNAYMAFVAPFIKTQSGDQEYVPSPPPSHTNGDNTDGDIVDVDDVPEKPTEHGNVESKPSTSTERVPIPKKKKERFYEPDRTFVENPEAKKKKVGSSSEASDNPRRQFVESLLPELDEMPEPTFRRFKREVLRLIDDLMTTDDYSYPSLKSSASKRDVTNCYSFRHRPEDEMSLEQIKNEVDIDESDPF